ncbi:hypothetical protein IX51_11395 [uncultured archaeon]|nr:hypothetical protein IX51_11395 [uncultured archaeon]HKJ97102.1 cytochrome bc complex cytochrome b subunit [Thermoplasmataceae archaeon]
MADKKKYGLSSILKSELGDDPLRINELPVRRVPDYMRKKGGIWYWTGALITMAFLYQVITGLILLLYYNAGNPYVSTEFMLTNIPYGALFLTTHLYGAYAMIVLVYVHMFRNYFYGSYKKPRQIQWILGVILLATTIGVGYFGYSMTGDVLAIDATDVGRGIAAALPVIGNPLASIFFGGGTTVSLFEKMLGWHVILAAVVGGLFGLHFYLAETNSMAPSHKESNYKAPAIDEEKPSYKQWNPYNMVFMIQLALFTFGAIILITSIIDALPSVPTLFDPYPQVAPSSPLAAYVPTYPPWFLLFVYKAVDFEMFLPFGEFSALAATVVFAVIPLLYFLGLPFIDSNNDLHPLGRPIITAFGILGIIYMAILSLWGALSPGTQIPVYETAVVLIPPFIVVVGGMLLIGRLYKKGKFEVSSNKLIGSSILFLLLLMFTMYSLTQNFSSFLSTPNGLNLAATFFSGGVTVFAAVGTMKSAQATSKYESTNSKKKSNPVPLSINSAIVISAILAVVAVGIMYAIWGLDPVDIVAEATFGIGLGVILIIGGVILRVYRMAVYNE